MKVFPQQETTGKAHLYPLMILWDKTEGLRLNFLVILSDCTLLVRNYDARLLLQW